MLKTAYILFTSVTAGLLYWLWSPHYVARHLHILCTLVIAGLIYILSSSENGQGIQGKKWLLFLASSLVPMFIFRLISTITSCGQLFGDCDEHRFYDEYRDFLNITLGYMFLSWFLCFLRVFWLALKRLVIVFRQAADVNWTR